MKFYCSIHEIKKTKTVLVGVPYDGTSTYRPGSRFAPQAIREASYGIESYSPYQDKDLRDIRFYDIGDIPLSYGDKELNLKLIEAFIIKLIMKGKKTLALGGEHLITYPLIKAYAKKYKEFAIVQLDAHSDLIDSYRGESLSHATVMRRCSEIVGFENLYQLGIRSMVEEDKLLPHRDVNMGLFDLSKAEEFLKRIGDKPIYLTVDLDVLDPSIFPGTGTPEPGGITYKEILSFLKLLRQKKIIGADVVELSPHYDPTGVSSVVAASIVREILLIMGN
ncbi:agmatinase [Hippea maritima]|uniref:Agmatinase n=1 Tax=Hippea maritima (strain ATCC 700847 / DSM 10411 / MH2) TaxID=760142 RepID=F2LTM0_HIPMA|nr:agmatinase [Hippea maritima]AEA33345.1 agmatinase [Hippea maritima DSM 10411]